MPIARIGYGRLGAVSLRHFRRVGLGLTAALSAALCALLFRGLGPADEDAGKGGVVATAHPVVVDQQGVSGQSQINHARIQGIGAEMQASTGRHRGAAELALVGGYDRLVGPISLAVRVSRLPTRVSSVVVLPPGPDPGGKRGAGSSGSTAGAPRPCRIQPTLTSRPFANSAQTYPGREAPRSAPAPARSKPCRREPGCAPSRLPAQHAAPRRPARRVARRRPRRRPWCCRASIGYGPSWSSRSST